MATLKTIEAGDSRPPLNSCSAGSLVAVPVRFDIAADNNQTPIATGDILELASLPRGHVLVDCMVDSDAIAGATVDIGYTAATGGTGQEIATGMSLATAALQRADEPGMTRQPVNDDNHQVIAMTFTAGSAAVAGVIHATLMYRASHFDI